MKARTNNMVGIIDNIDKSRPFADHQPEKGPLYFTGKSHYQYHNRLVKETETGANDWERLTLFYILASIKKFREEPNKFLFFNEIKPNPQAFRELLSKEEQALIQLAFHLYSGRKVFEINLLDLFTNLGEEKTLIAINAIKLRFNITYELFKK